MILGIGALYFFLVFFNIAGEFLVNTAGFAIPAYYSLEALFTSSKTDDSQWLTVCSLHLGTKRTASNTDIRSTGSSTPS